MRAFEEGSSVQELGTLVFFPPPVTYEGLHQHVIYFTAVLKDAFCGVDQSPVYVLK